MAYYIIKRFFYSIVSLFIVITATFFLMHAMPGSVYTSEKALPPAIEANVKAKYGLDKSLQEQYLITLKNMATLDFGMSMKNEGRSVNSIIAEHFPVSAELGLFSMMLVILGGVPLGVISAFNRGKWQDTLIRILVTLGVTVPGFVIAALSQYFLSVKLHWFPVMGFTSFRHWILPGIALSFFSLSFISRLIRSGMIEALEQDFIRTARAKGLSETIVVYKHALKNALLPAISVLGPLAAGILTGTFVIESVFSIPGLGRFFVSSIGNRDYTVIMGITVFYAFFLLLMVLIVDILYVLIDPRIKLKN